MRSFAKRKNKIKDLLKVDGSLNRFNLNFFNKTHSIVQIIHEQRLAPTLNVVEKLKE